MFTLWPAYALAGAITATSPLSRGGDDQLLDWACLCGFGIAMYLFARFANSPRAHELRKEDDR